MSSQQSTLDDSMSGKLAKVLQQVGGHLRVSKKQVSALEALKPVPMVDCKERDKKRINSRQESLW